MKFLISRPKMHSQPKPIGLIEGESHCEALEKLGMVFTRNLINDGFAGAKREGSLPANLSEVYFWELKEVNSLTDLENLIRASD